MHNSVGFSASSLDWKTASYHSPKTRQCLNVTLVGCKHSDLERAKKEITQYIEGIEYNDIDPDMILDLVSAELNPGIAKHLVHRDPYDFEEWRKELSKFFNVYFWINKDIPKIEIWGSFDSILQTEQYFENEFPMSPSKSEIALLEIDDQHYEQPKWVTLTIPCISRRKLHVIKKFLKQ
ncbi:uncharacterized protein LOC132721669 [Ruditapes philippinarum]|uniref:uncharacterized protein LOC132721669 n=1 Tax=Ruditapes philippinarum TaxID=129788 RepID=UPI00295AE929|nr:uncharacterized protein LOC132721669 [Ruditapes philippinarum]